VALGRWSHPAETIEFSVSYTTEKRVPFIGCKSENRPSGVPAVADADLARGKARHLYAVAVGETQRALYPVKTSTWPFGRISVRRSSHRWYLTDCWRSPEMQKATQCRQIPTYRSHSVTSLTASLVPRSGSFPKTWPRRRPRPCDRPIRAGRGQDYWSPGSRATVTLVAISATMRDRMIALRISMPLGT
jgi:hypothetical protein